MISSSVYDYVNVLDKAADASWLRQQAISNNIANYDTPGYKRQDVDFEGALKQAIQSARGTTMDAKINHLRKGSLDVSTYIDHGDFSYRMDGNNVDVEQEQVELAANSVKYQALMQSVNQEFTNLQSVMKK